MCKCVGVSGGEEVRDVKGGIHMYTCIDMRQPPPPSGSALRSIYDREGRSKGGQSAVKKCGQRAVKKGGRKGRSKRAVKEPRAESRGGSPRHANIHTYIHT